MFLPGWLAWWVLLTLRLSACALEISGYDMDEVVCSQGLSECSMKDAIPLLAENDGVDVQKLTAHFQLCSKTKASCTLCLVIDTELHVHPGNDVEDQGHSGLDEEEDGEETRNPRASVTMCYQTVSTMPTCKKVEFTVNQTAFTQQSPAKMTMVITRPAGVSFSSRVSVNLPKLHLTREVVVPSLETVCSREQKKCVDECSVPELRIVIPKEMDHVELQFDGRNDGPPSVCIQYEQNGTCPGWKRTSIPLYSVTPCTCLQVWYDGKSVRSLSCPFRNMGFAQKNVWKNLSVSVGQGQRNSYGPMLSWNLSAPCRLEGEVWPCHRGGSCRGMKGFRQQLAHGTWRQNRKGLWVRTGAFQDINLQLSPCVMVKIKGMAQELGPFCFNNTERWRWTLLAVGVLLLVCLTVLVLYILHGYVKKWVWSCRHGGFVKVGGGGHVVLLSPPDVDHGVSESVCQLGSLLGNRGFNVSVDQWSRKEQCILGPLPWLHSQLLKLNGQGNRVVLVLSHRALQRTEEWTLQQREVVKTETEDVGLPQIWSPYSDVFTASLCLIQADKQLGRAGERFLLVKFDSNPSKDRNLPELLRGLPLFHLPSQTQALLTELTLERTERRSGGKTWAGWKWVGEQRLKRGPDLQRKVNSFGVDKNLETKPLKQP